MAGRSGDRRRAILAIGAVVLAGCTTVGVHTKERDQVEYGPPLALNVCILKSPDVPLERADSLIAAVDREFMPYGIDIVVPWMRD